MRAKAEWLSYSTTPPALDTLDLIPEMQSASATTSTQVVKICGSVMRKNARFYKSKTIQNGASSDVFHFYRHATNGLVCYTSNTTTPWYLIKTPLIIGSKWVLPPLPGGIVRRVLGTNATTTVPAGTFTGCLSIKQVYTNASMNTLSAKYWYAPGVGLVRWEFRSGTWLTNKCELKSHTIL